MAKRVRKAVFPVAGLEAHLESQGPGSGGEIQLTDALASLARDEGMWGVRYEGRRFDCGSRLGFVQATVACALERAELREALLPFLRNIAQEE